MSAILGDLAVVNADTVVLVGDNLSVQDMERYPWVSSCHRRR